MQPGGERGAVLLEVLVAVAILAAAGMATIELLAASARQLTVAVHRERESVEAARILAAATLLDQDDLDRRLGDRFVAGFVVNVQRPERGLYRVAVSLPADDSVRRSGELLVTVVHRPAEPVRR